MTTPEPNDDDIDDIEDLAERWRSTRYGPPYVLSYVGRAIDPDWRRRMPLRWRLNRWWSIHWPIIAAIVALAAVNIICIIVVLART